MDILNSIAQLGPCEFCGAPSGIPCVTARGRRLPTIHGTRWYAAAEVIKRVLDYYYTMQQKALDNAAQAIAPTGGSVPNSGRTSRGG